MGSGSVTPAGSAGQGRWLGEGSHGARAAQGHRLPPAMLAGRTELLGRHGERAAVGAADGREASRAGFLEEVLQGDHTLSHGRAG